MRVRSNNARTTAAIRARCSDQPTSCRQRAEVDDNTNTTIELSLDASSPLHTGHAARAPRQRDAALRVSDACDDDRGDSGHRRQEGAPAATPATASLLAQPGDVAEAHADDEPLATLLVRAAETIKTERARVASLTGHVMQLRGCLAAVLHAYDDATTKAAPARTQKEAEPAATRTAVSAAQRAHGSYYRSRAPSHTVRKDNDKADDVGSALLGHAAAHADEWRRALADVDTAVAASPAEQPPSAEAPCAHDDVVERGGGVQATENAAHSMHSRQLSNDTGSTGGSVGSRSSAPCADDAHATALPRPHGQDCAGAVVPHTEHGATSAMITRLRRALAPPPTTQRLGDVVDAMVRALQADVHKQLARQREAGAATSRGGGDVNGDEATARTREAERTFVFRRRGPCQYVLRIGTRTALRARERVSDGVGGGVRGCVDLYRPASHDGVCMHAVGVHGAVAGMPTCVRRSLYGDDVREYVVHLSIDSGRLCVAAGGGHVDILEYLERKLRVPL